MFSSGRRLFQSPANQGGQITEERIVVGRRTSFGAVLVTGASGHLGANLVRRLLADGEHVRVLLHPDHDNSGVEGLDVEVAYADIRNPVGTRQAIAGCDFVYHCAAKVSTIDGDASHKGEIYDTNVIGTRNVLSAAREAGSKRVVVTGSFSAVGMDPSDSSAPSDETMSFYPFGRTMPYELSKVMVEHECLKAVADGLHVVIATCCAIVGGNDFLPSRLGRTLCAYANGKLPYYIDGGFEFVSASDIVQGHLLCMSRGLNGRKYIFSTEYLELDALLGLFAEASGVRNQVRKLPGPLMYAFSEVASYFLSRFRPDFPQRFTPGAIRLLRKRRHADLGRARRELGYRPGNIRDAVFEAYAFHYARGAIQNAGARVPNAENGFAGRAATGSPVKSYPGATPVKTG